MNQRTALAAALAGLLMAAGVPTAATAQTVLKASHQFPGGKGDVRDEMVQMIAREVAAANVGLEIKVFPGSSLVKATEQWKAMLTGQIDMTSFPLDYAVRLPPAVRRHADARPGQGPRACKRINELPS
jgi:TRAP-type C4-dicarboxylate transport system substrate-binding protein